MAEPSETTQVSGGRSDHPEQEELLGAVRALSAQVGDLRAELQALRAETRALPLGSADVHGWEEPAHLDRDWPAWIRSVDSPFARRPAVPRFVLEVLFLVAVATLAAVAKLDAPVVVTVVAGAWVLVAATEWLASRSDRQQEALRDGIAIGGAMQGDASWFEPPAERASAALAEDTTGSAARLPPAQSG